MSKTSVKKLLASMDKSDIIEMVLELYSARKEAKEYLDYYADPDENAKLEEYKRIITKEFFPASGRSSKLRFSVCRKAIADFKKLKPSEEALADLMVTLVENACRYAHDSYELWEQYYTSVETNYEAAVSFVAKNNLWKKFDARLKKCLQWADSCGWGLADALNSLYKEAKGTAKE